MMLHDKIIPGQFLLDMKNDCNSNIFNGNPQANKLDMYNTYNFHHHQAQHQQRLQSPQTEGEVLDLSRRCDSVETRKTPSPYNSTSSFGTVSPSTHCGSPSNSTQTSAPTSAVPLTPTPTLPNKLIFSQTTPPPLPQGIASLYPLYYPSIKQEMASPPPQPAAPTNTNQLPMFPQNPAVILQQAFNRTSPAAAYTSPKPEEQQCTNPPSFAMDASTMLYPNILNAATTGTVNSGKTTRPFNAYPRDPMMVAAHFAASDVLWDKTTMERYSTYRKRALDDLRDTNGGHRIVTNPKMRRTNNRNTQSSECEERAMESSDNDSSTGNGSSAEKNDTNNNNDCSDSAFNSSGVKDDAYYERRRKNNAAAKKSRDRRRIKEDEIAIRAAYLERQNIELLCQIDALKKQLEAFTKV